jgi:hypothetical protein
VIKGKQEMHNLGVQSLLNDLGIRWENNIKFNDISCGQAWKWFSKIRQTLQICTSEQEITNMLWRKSSQCRFNKSFPYLLLLETIFAVIQCTVYTVTTQPTGSNWMATQPPTATTNYSPSYQAEVTPRKLATAMQPWFPRTVINQSWTHVTDWSSANWVNSNATCRKADKLNFQVTEHATLLKTALTCGFLVSAGL